MSKPKTFVYESFGQALEFAARLGFDEEAEDDGDPDALEHAALEFIKSKGVEVIEEGEPSGAEQGAKFWKAMGVIEDGWEWNQKLLRWVRVKKGKEKPEK